MNSLTTQQPDFSTIRKAIKGASEELASKEFLETPEQRHIDSVISTYKTLKYFSPDTFNKFVIMTAKGKELKDELGVHLYQTFTHVWEEMTVNFKKDLEKSLMSLAKTKILSGEELTQETIVLSRRYLANKSDLLKKDPRILAAFAGKEESLDKVLDYIIGLVDFAADTNSDLENILKTSK